MTETIRDKAGREYSLEWFEPPGIFFGWAIIRDVKVAEISGDHRGEVLHVGNLRVSDDVRFPQPWWLRFFGRFSSPQNFRRTGLGTSLLQATIARARMHGFREITGDVVGHDLEEFPGLPDWYARMGFEVDPRGVGPIRLRL